MKLNDKGMTMVEVVVGFVLLAIVFAAFIKIINLASDMTQSSIDIRKQNDDLKKAYYSGVDKSENGIVLSSTLIPKTIKIKEWTKNGDYYDGWHKNSDGEFVIESVSSYECTLNNTALYRIEDLNNSNANAVYFFAKYVYTRPTNNIPVQEGN